MGFTLGSILVKGGKVISTGYNHHRHFFDGIDIQTRGHSQPFSIHAEMDAIRNFIGVTPSFKKHLKGTKEREDQVTRKRRPRECGGSQIVKNRTGTQKCLLWIPSIMQMPFVQECSESHRMCV